MVEELELNLIGGGSGTLAARIAGMNVTIVTATLNVDAPFNELTTARGFFPLYLSLHNWFLVMIMCLIWFMSWMSPEVDALSY
uniref:ATRAD3 n=1 Tax=Solanum tuberosum TaxID=4113 RepID=M1D7U7_SOLTU